MWRKKFCCYDHSGVIVRQPWLLCNLTVNCCTHTKITHCLSNSSLKLLGKPLCKTMNKNKKILKCWNLIIPGICNFVANNMVIQHSWIQCIHKLLLLNHRLQSTDSIGMVIILFVTYLLPYCNWKSIWRLHIELYSEKHWISMLYTPACN